MERAVANQKLTKSHIDDLEPQAADKIYWDADIKGFGLKVTPKGRKVFLVQHRPKGHTGAAKKYVIGKYGEWTLQSARDRAREVMMESSKGIDTGTTERAMRHKQSTDRVSDLVEQFLEKHASQNKSAAEVGRMLRREVVPKIGNRSVHNITKHDVNLIIEEIAKRGSPIMANRVLANVRKFFNWCVARAVIDVSPAQGIPAITRERSRDRVLTKDETRSVLMAARQIGFPFGTIVELLFLTAQRLNEVAEMRWSELDLESSLWTLPAARAKNGKAHDVHLSKWAVTLLRSIPRIALPDGSETDFVFTTTGTTAVSGFSKAKSQIDKLSQVTNWRLHDIRRTVVTEMSKMGVPVHVADAILNHKSGTISGVTAVYQRNEFTNERKQAMTDWADLLNDRSL